MATLLGKKSKEKLVEELLLENYNRYYRLAWSYVRNGDDALDIVQNGVYKAILHSAELRKKEYAGTWIYRIMLNEIRDFLKKPKAFSIDAMENGEEGGEGALRGREELSKEDSYEDVDLSRALDSLSPEDKLVVELRYFEDRKLEEIADILEENVNTVKSRLYRSLRKLKVKLGENEEAVV